MEKKFAYRNVLPRRHRTGKCHERRARESQVPTSHRLSPGGHAFPTGGKSHGGLASHALWFPSPPLHTYRSRSILLLQQTNKYQRRKLFGRKIVKNMKKCSDWTKNCPDEKLHGRNIFQTKNCIDEKMTSGQLHQKIAAGCDYFLIK